MWKCTDCLGIPQPLYSALFGCKELKWFCADCDKGCPKSKDKSVGIKNSEMLDEILSSVNRVFEKLGGFEEKLKGKADISDVVRLEERLTALEARLDSCERRGGGPWVGRRGYVGTFGGSIRSGASRTVKFL